MEKIKKYDPFIALQNKAKFCVLIAKVLNEQTYVIDIDEQIHLLNIVCKDLKRVYEEEKGKET